MRARSNTLCFSNLEDYIEAAKLTTSYIPSRRSRPQPKKLILQNTEKQYKEIALDDDVSPPSLKIEEKDQNSSDDWLDFDFDSQKLSKDERVLSSSTTINTIDTDCSDGIEENSNGDVKNSVLRRVMIIGLDGTGKHSLINTAFACERQSFQNKSQVLDLLTKTEQDEDEEREIRYQFWIQNLKSGDDNAKNYIADLVKLYYKNVSTFVFMYSTANKESFTCLEGAIKSVLQEVSAEKFVGVLVGTKSDLEEQREVSFCEAASLQEYFNLNSLVETHQTDKSFKRTFSDLLNKTEEESRERRISILSMD